MIKITQYNDELHVKSNHFLSGCGSWAHLFYQNDR